MRVDLRGPFGIHIGTIVLSGEQFLFYNRHENVVITGKADTTTLESMFHINFRLDEIRNAFTGELPFNIQPDSLSKYYVDEGSYIFITHTGTQTREYSVDGGNFILTNYKVYDNEGSVSMVANATDIEDANNTMMPTHILVRFQKERQSVNIEYSDVYVNQPVECTFSIPKTAKIITR